MTIVFKLYPVTKQEKLPHTQCICLKKRLWENWAGRKSHLHCLFATRAHWGRMEETEMSIDKGNVQEKCKADPQF